MDLGGGAAVAVATSQAHYYTTTICVSNIPGIATAAQPHEAVPRLAIPPPKRAPTQRRENMGDVENEKKIAWTKPLPDDSHPCGIYKTIRGARFEKTLVPEQKEFSTVR